MPRDQERRRKKLERKAAKRKERKQGLGRSEVAVVPPSQRRLLRGAGEWPLYECLITRDWNQEAALVQAIVARRSPVGQIGAAVFLVDLGLLGVKNALARAFETQRDYEELVEQMQERAPMVKTDLNSVAKIIDEAMAYAKRYGFSPHQDYYQAAPFLTGAEPEKSHVTVPLGGPEGKPIYVAGPYDNAQRIIAQLTRTAGEGNFHYTVPIGGSPADFFDEDEEDEE